MNNNIVLLLYEIKDNIKLLTKENHEKQLNIIKSDFLEMMELLKLFLISERNTYYGYFLMNMKFEVNFSSDMIAGIKLNTFPPVFESNPLNLCRFKMKEIIYIICHEIDHIVLNHPAEMVKVNPHKQEDLFFKFNLAADAAVNDRLNNEIEHNSKYMLEPEGIVTSETIEKMFNLKGVRKLENYAYYFNLIKDLKTEETNNAKNYMMSELAPSDVPEDSSSDNSSSQNFDEQSEEENNNDSKSSPSSDQSDNQEGDSDPENLSYQVSDGQSDMEDHNWDSGDSSFAMEDLVKEFVNSTYSMIDEESRGLMPANFIEQIEIINQPATLSWKQILKKYVGTIVAGKRKTRTRLNRRQPERFDLSGRMDDKIIKIVVAIDTSGSVSDTQIAKIFNEIFSIIATRKKEITVIECDAEVQRVYKVSKQSDIKLKVKGRGGTWFSPVIKYINKDKYFRDALLIYFTDGGGEEKIPKPLTYRNIWVLTESDELSVEEPYGIVLKMD